MSKKRSRAQKRATAPRRKQRRTQIVVGAILALSLAIGVAGQFEAVRRAPLLRAFLSPPVPLPTIPPPDNPSKEYIYAGGKLIATEDSGNAWRTCSASQTSSTSQFIKDFYQGALGRQPSSQELASWTFTLRQGFQQGYPQMIQAAQSLGDSLFLSAEYAGRNRDDSQFITDLYLSYLNTSPDSGGLGFWVSIVQGQTNGREAVRQAFAGLTDIHIYQDRIFYLCPDGTPITQSGTVPSNLLAAAASGTQINLSWGPVTGATRYRVERGQSIYAQFIVVGNNVTTTSFQDIPPASSGSTVNAYLYQVCAADAGGACVSGYSNMDWATAIAYDPIVSNSTLIRAEDFNDLRIAVNAIRGLAGIGGFNWAPREPGSPDHAAPTIGEKVSATHIMQLRTKMDQALQTLGPRAPAANTYLSTGYFEPSITSTSATPVRRVHVTEIRDRVKGYQP